MKKKRKNTASMQHFGKLLQRARLPDLDKLYIFAKREKFRRLGVSRDQLDIEDEPFYRIPNSTREVQRQATSLGIPGNSLRKVAKLMGISKNTLHDYEKGKRYPSAEFVYDFCTALEIPSEKLVNDWVRCHPNPNVSSNKRFGKITRFFKDVKNNSVGYEKRNVIGLIRSALQLAVASEVVSGVLPADKIGRISSKAAIIIDQTLAKGLEVHSSSIPSDWESYFEENSDQLQRGSK